MKKLDDIDVRLLNLLQLNAKLTNKELGSKLNLSPTPIFERIKKLEKAGYIKNYVALLDREKIGKKTISFVSVSIQNHLYEKVDTFINKIEKLPEVIECHHISGKSDFLLKVITEDIESYHDFVVNRLAAIENIANIESSFVLKEIKQGTAFEL